ncbi:16S rRNA (guanine(966)-N(2))-methyltransferase RsmD [soil metagenome]
MADGGRVIGGSASGLRLLVPGEGTRPLTDRVKQSLFGALAADGAVGEGTSFLDLFAGSGAAGIEALSLGAARAVFVERDAGATWIIGRNLAHIGLQGGTVVRADVLRFLERDSAAAGAPFDACLADPPYVDESLVAVLERLGDPGRGWLTEGALVVAKHFWRDEQPSAAGGLAKDRQKRFGETALTFYRYRQ